ncbi:MAG: hypothetical protein K2I79_03620 [Clostridia bacterium]|nr:hypothetical protein [Clostridia bacterium]
MINLIKKTNFLTIVFLAACLIGIVCLMTVMPMYFTSAQTLTDDEYDLQCKQTLDELELGLSGNIDIEKSPVYDAELQVLGYEYEFVSEGSRGYMIIIEDVKDGFVKVSEVVADAESPYNNAVGTPIYLSELNYADYNDGIYTIIREDKQLTYEQIEDTYETRYAAAGEMTSTTKKIEYASREVDKLELAVRIPSYVGVDLVGACVPVMGGNIITFYDRVCVNLIPNFTPCSSMGSLHMYKGQTQEINDLIKTLYYGMNPSSTTTGGHTIAGFMTGMDSYCKGKGYNASYSECASNGKLNYSTAKTKLKAGQPIALFVNNVEFVSIQEYDDYDYLYTYYKEGVAHAMTAFGYKEITYTFSNGSTQKEDYIYLATGYGDTLRAYMNINNRMTIDAAYAVNIS